MATRWLRWPLGGLLTLSVALGTTAAWGSPCIQDAKGEYRNCKASCVEDFQVAKDACLNRDHPCVEGCRAERGLCREGTGSDQPFAASDATLDAAKQDCRDKLPAGWEGLHRSRDRAQGVACGCR